MKKLDFSSRKVAEIKDCLDLQKELSSAELSALRSDSRKGVKRLLTGFLKRREKEIQKEKRLHKMLLPEKAARKKGFKLVAGVDEAGRGPLAGPVVAAAVILGAEEASYWGEINDSKKLAPTLREKLYDKITTAARSFAVGVVSADVIDRINIYQASLEAMNLSVRQLRPQPNFLFSDGFSVPGLTIPQKPLKGGDALCLSIAAASIVAKVTRDRIMENYDKIYPGYGFAKHKGYPTPEHKAAIKALGFSPLHRRTFKYD